MDEYTNLHHPNYIPGTFNIYSSSNLENGIIYGSRLKKNEYGVVLIPQPSDSPNDPLNWSKLRKFGHFGLMSFITAFTAATSNDAGAAQDSLNEIYGISYDAMNTGAGVLFLGIGWATLFLAPLANLYGRKVTYIICTTLGLFGALWFALAKRTSDTIWSQLFVGISESCAEAQVQLSLSDIYFQHQLGSVLTVYILCTSIGTFLGPLIAGYISSLTTFRWVGWVAVIISGALLLAIVFGCEETYFDRNRYVTPLTSQRVLQNFEDGTTLQDRKDAWDEKGVKVTKNEGSQELMHRRESDELQRTITARDEVLIDGSKEKIKCYSQRVALITKATNLKGWGVRQYFKYLGLNLRMFLFPPVWLSGLFWGIQDVFLSFYLTTEEDTYYDAPWNYSDYGVAIMNVPTLIGAVIGCIYAGIVSDYFVLWMARKNNGILEAEYRLYFSFATAIIGPAGLLMFGIGTAHALPWQVMYVGLGFIGFSWGCSGDIAMSYLMDCYPEMVLEGMVCTAIINNTISCIFTFTCSYWLDASGTQNTYIALAVINFGITLLALPMFFFGKRFRKLTKKWYIQSVEMRDGL
ncbi:LAFE_0A05776g1_1 [Lachancea fermentati]|uniref:LAFE_0A05776g1_1 n=1 Tax=Lachancea fermentati TaxID=4955 RepID=A0A1G4M6U5_LACFM|nr:LAFE_0A05776g1_1 [Lachancea fermentati]